MQNLLKRGHSWYVRYVVPRKYREAFGKNEVVRALQTCDLDVARDKKLGVLAQIAEVVQKAVYPHLSTPVDAIEQAISMAEDIAEAEGSSLIQGVVMEMIQAR